MQNLQKEMLEKITNFKEANEQDFTEELLNLFSSLGFSSDGDFRTSKIDIDAIAGFGLNKGDAFLISFNLSELNEKPNIKLNFCHEAKNDELQELFEIEFSENGIFLDSFQNELKKVELKFTQRLLQNVFETGEIMTVLHNLDLIFKNIVFSPEYSHYFSTVALQPVEEAE